MNPNPVSICRPQQKVAPTIVLTWTHESQAFPDDQVLSLRKPINRQLEVRNLVGAEKEKSFSKYGVKRTQVGTEIKPGKVGTNHFSRGTGLPFLLGGRERSCGRFHRLKALTPIRWRLSSPNFCGVLPSKE